jgi:hypothetical protein
MLNPNQKQCTAQSKRNRARCLNPAAFGKSVCRMHGASAPSGIAHSNLKHGRYSKYLPKHLFEKFAEAQSQTNEEMLSLSAEICLVDARINETLEKLENASNRQKDALWREIKALLQIRRKLTLTETKRLELIKNFVPIKSVLLMLGAVQSAVLREISDPEKLRRIQREMNRFLLAETENAPPNQNDNL